MIELLELDKKEITQDVLHRFTMELIPAILNIDNGCGTCIENFVCDYNAKLKKMGAEFQLHYDSDVYALYIGGVDVAN